MTATPLAEKARAYLQALCVQIPQRPVGSEGNRAATAMFAATMASFGFKTECPEFDCIDWADGGARLTVDGQTFEPPVSPYSLGGHARAPLVVATTVEELETIDAAGKVLLVRGEIAREQLMPKNFTFYNPEHHQRIVALLERQAPAAIVAATSRDPELAGAVYPFPLIEDGDFDIPSVYMTEEEGERLVRYAGREVCLDIVSTRIPAKGYNVIARKGAEDGRRAVVCAHIDAKAGTPGAIDNAGSVVALLLLAELLESCQGSLGIEIVAFNGEDYYAAPGQMQYIKRNAGRFGEIGLAINLDGVGYHVGKTAYSMYGCPPEIEASVRKAFAAYDAEEGEPWYQGDHSIFIQNGTPALAITSDHLMHVLNDIAHTPKDRPEIVDTEKLVQVASALRDLLLDLAGPATGNP